MKLARVRQRITSADHVRSVRYAIVEDDQSLRLLPQEWTFPEALGALGDAESIQDGAEPASLDAWELIAPVPSPASLRDCVGFLQHIRNTRRSRGDVAPLPAVWDERPGFYFGNPHSVRSSTHAIAIPSGSTSFDFELEIAAVIGRGGRDLTFDEAAEAIAGYVLFCDWSARDLQAQERTMQTGLGKGKDAANSLGPWILSADEAASVRRIDGLDIVVSAHVNDELVTAPGTRYLGMDWAFEEIVAYASMSVDLFPGDVIAVGTVPTGCLLETSANDDFRGWLAPGDRVRLSAGPLGDISTTITSSVAPANWRRARSN
jgi:2-keto-4-pentenoate hydratase/2-oxohepta-3-ene-1,7-dioic acid hydratase in catechol pathway